MVFDAEQEKLRCENCDSVMSFDEYEAKAEVEEEFIPRQQETVEKGDFKAYRCPSCGAEMLTDEHTTAAICSFCGSPGLMEDRLAGQARPTEVIPFKITRNQAVERFLKWTKKGLLTPKDFTSAQTLEKISGIYVPYWLYDYDTEVVLRAHCTRIGSVRRKGDKEYTDIHHYDVYRDVECDYKGIPADASEKMNDNLMDTLEPYQYQDLKTFEMPYLAGYLSEKYNYTSSELQGRAKNKVRGFAFSEAQNTIKGYASVQILDRRIRIGEKKAEYVLLPVWLLNYRYQNKNYQFALNGQTGKLVGNLPISKGKVAAWFGGLAGGLFVLLTLVGGLVL